MIGFNRNIGCIEMRSQVRRRELTREFNRNIGCIEIIVWDASVNGPLPV